MFLFKDVKDFLCNKKSDLIWLGIFTVIFILLCFLTWGRMGDIIADAGREAYVSQEILNGKIFMKDVMVLFNICPLSFQINALLFKIFGANLTILNLASIIATYLILFFSYLIARFFFSPFVSFSAVALITAFGVFVTYAMGYILTYSYGTLYATLGLIAALFFASRAILNSKSPKFNKYMVLSCFSIGFSIANKLDYIQIALLIALIPFFAKQFSLKKYFIYILSVIVIPFLSAMVLVIKGFSFSDFQAYLQLAPKYYETIKPFSQFFFIPSFGKYFNILFHSALIFAVVFVPCCIAAFLCSRIRYKKIAGFIVSILIFSASFFNTPAILKNGDVYYSYNVMFTCVVPLIFIAFIYVILKRKQFLAESKDFVALLLLIAALLSLLKTYFFVYLPIYGAFMMPMIVIALFLILFKYLPDVFCGIKNSKNYNDITSLAIVFFSIFFLGLNISYQTSEQAPVYSRKGVIYATKPKDYIINESLKYIKENVKPNEVVLVIPDGVMINFLSGRQTNSKYFQLIPNHIDVFGERNIVKDLSLNPPDYVFIHNRQTPEAGRTTFCKGYGFEICDFVMKNYDEVDFISSHNPNTENRALMITEMRIFKHK